MAYEHFEKIFDEPAPDLDTIDASDFECVSYDATATRTGKQWTVTVHGLPAGHAVVAQGATWADAHHNAHAAVHSLIGGEPWTVAINLWPDDSEAAEALRDVINARTARGEAEIAEREAVAHAAQLLTGKKEWTTRDAGSALHLSHQRISQLAPRATE